MSEKGKVGACPVGHLTRVKGMLHEEDLAPAGCSRGGGLAVRAGRHSAGLRGRDGHLHSYGHRYSHSYGHRYSHGHGYYYGHRDSDSDSYGYGYSYRTAQERRTVADYWAGCLGGRPDAHGLRRWSADAGAA